MKERQRELRGQKVKEKEKVTEKKRKICVGEDIRVDKKQLVNE